MMEWMDEIEDEVDDGIGRVMWYAEEMLCVLNDIYLPMTVLWNLDVLVRYFAKKTTLLYASREEM